jgi:porphobilinogen synthase
MAFPQVRLRRLRENSVVRDMVREHALSLDDLVLPLFVVENLNQREEISSMPGQWRYPLGEIAGECRTLCAAGIRAVILFGVPAHKDPVGSGAYAPDGIMQKAIALIKAAAPGLLVITDVCLCEYTSHGHCGIVAEGRMLNDPTLELLAKTAVSHAQAGADLVAPSDMTDGRIQAIRSALDAAGLEMTPIMSYAAKYASAYYGPFREAADSAPQFGDRRGYQMDPANAREALREVAMDIAEGADIVMVKPALAYLDIIRQVRDTCLLPVAAYNVSGEYALVKAAAERGWVDEQRLVLETLTAIKRAGADIIISYHTADVAAWLGAIGPRSA